MKKENKQYVAFFIRFNPKSYSGGRIHAMLMAEAFSEMGYETHIFCNIIPELASDFEEYPRHNGIVWHKKQNGIFDVPNFNYKWVIVVPHRGSGWEGYGFYLQAAYVSFRSGAKVIFLNFESTSFFNSFSRFWRDPSEWEHWCRFVKYTDIILSSSKISNSYATGDYRSLISKPRFEHCYPSINSVAAKKTLCSDPKKQIIIFCRWIDPHKNSFGVLKVLSSDLEGYEVVIVSGDGEIPQAFIDSIKKKARKCKFGFRIVKCVDENEKFKMIAESKAMIFLSEFEGFGLPPVEAQYCGVPCVSFDLPVLREVNSEGLIYAECGDYDGIKRGIKQAIDMDDGQRAALRKNIFHIADFKTYCHHLEKILNQNSHNCQSVSCHIARRIAYRFEYALYRMCRYRKGGNYRKSDGKIDMSVLFLENYVRSQWKYFSCIYREKNLLVYGAIDYCMWLYEITKGCNTLNIEAVIEGNAETELILWGKKISSADTHGGKNIDAVILATECYQKKYAKRCKELFGNKVEIIDLYPGMPTGPYTKK